jgi:hypothetical protein
MRPQIRTGFQPLGDFCPPHPGLRPSQARGSSLGWYGTGRWPVSPFHEIPRRTQKINLPLLLAGALVAAPVFADAEFADEIPDGIGAWTERGVVLSHGTGWESDGKIFVQNILKVDGQYYLYYLGNDKTGLHNKGSNYVSLGLATSADGLTFTRHPKNPIVTAEQAVYVDSWEHGFRNAVIVHNENGWFMWASLQGIFDKAPGAAPRAQWRGDIEVDSKVFGFSSADGVHWTLQGPTNGAMNADGFETHPSSAEYHDGTYYLWGNRSEGGDSHFASMGTDPNALTEMGWIEALNFGWSHVETFLHADNNTVTLIYTPIQHPDAHGHGNLGKTHFATTSLSEMTAVSNKRMVGAAATGVEYRHAILKDANEWKWYYSLRESDGATAIRLRTAPLRDASQNSPNLPRAPSLASARSVTAGQILPRPSGPVSICLFVQD